MLTFSVTKEGKVNSFIFDSRNFELPLSFADRKVGLEIIGMDLSSKQKKKLSGKKGYHYNETTGILSVGFDWHVDGNKKIIIK